MGSQHRTFGNDYESSETIIFPLNRRPFVAYRLRDSKEPPPFRMTACSITEVMVCVWTMRNLLSCEQKSTTRAAP
jgi:hypothetical protein